MKYNRSKSRRNNLRITGLNEEYEDTRGKITSFLKDNLKLKIKKDDVSTAERIAVRRKRTDQVQENVRPRTILVKFNNHWFRRAVYRERFQLKDLWEGLNT